MKTRRKSIKNPNDHKRPTPSTEGKENSDKHFTSYDTSEKGSESPQQVRESNESAGEHQRKKKSKS